jgi:hypothetical protein
MAQRFSAGQPYLPDAANLQLIEDLPAFLKGKLAVSFVRSGQEAMPAAAAASAGDRPVHAFFEAIVIKPVSLLFPQRLFLCARTDKIRCEKPFHERPFFPFQFVKINFLCSVTASDSFILLTRKETGLPRIDI